MIESKKGNLNKGELQYKEKKLIDKIWLFME